MLKEQPPGSSSAHTGCSWCSLTSNQPSYTYIFPAQGCLAVLTIDICHGMQACEQNSLLCGTTPNVHPESGEISVCVEKIGRKKKKRERQESETSNSGLDACTVRRVPTSDSLPDTHSLGTHTAVKPKIYALTFSQAFLFVTTVLQGTDRFNLLCSFKVCNIWEC